MVSSSSSTNSVEKIGDQDFQISKFFRLMNQQFWGRNFHQLIMFGFINTDRYNSDVSVFTKFFPDNVDFEIPFVFWFSIRQDNHYIWSISAIAVLSGKFIFVRFLEMHNWIVKV